MNIKKVIKSVSICLAITLCSAVFGNQAVFAAQDKSKSNDIIYTEHNGKKYGFEQKVKNNGSRYETNVYTDGVLTDVVITDFKTGKITNNGVEVGFVREQWTLEKTPLSKLNAAKLAKGDMIIIPYSMTTPYEGYGGGIYTYVRSYTTGFSALTYGAAYSATAALATAALNYIYDRLGLPKRYVILKDSFTQFVIWAIGHFSVNRNYYVKVYDTGTVNVNGQNYRRAALEYYSDNSHTNYLKTEWADGYIAP